MNTRALLFALLGLVAITVPMTAWVMGDIRELRAAKEARLVQECAERRSSPATPVAAPATTLAPEIDHEPNPCDGVPASAGAAPTPAAAVPVQPGPVP